MQSLAPPRSKILILNAYMTKTAQLAADTFFVKTALLLANEQQQCFSWDSYYGARPKKCGSSVEVYLAL